jgi:hypothetical protein
VCLKEEEIIENERGKRHRKLRSLKGIADKHTYSDIHPFDHKNSCD